MADKKDIKKVTCKMCGRCCHMEIPLTILDIHRMAKFEGVPASHLFQNAVQDAISERSSLFMIRKDAEGACLFLNDEKRCSVHQAKPTVCRFYNCSLQGENGAMPWTATCTDPAERALLWEQSVAAMVTKTYIEKNGPVWNETDFRMALKAIEENIPVRDTQKIKLARDVQGAPVGLIYDCSACEKQGMCTRETPVTLDDIRRISDHLGVTLSGFFKSYISTESSVYFGGLKLKREIQCVFFRPNASCVVEDVKPVHCRFTPCPMRVRTPEIMDALYLGSGTVEEQFRHQAAMAVTRDYVSQCGARYLKRDMERSLARIDRLTASAFELKGFCKQIARFRYVDDTLPILDT